MDTDLLTAAELVLTLRELRKALGTIQPGIIKSFMPHGRTLDYSHHLTPEHRRAGYSLMVHQISPGFNRAGEARSHKTTSVYATLHHSGKEVGAVGGHISGSNFSPDSYLNPTHRGSGLGTSMYEVALRHAMLLGAKSAGNTGPSADAAAVHQRLSHRHGLATKGQPGKSYQYALR